MKTCSWKDPVTVDRYISGRVSSEADCLVARRLGEISPKLLLELGTGPGTIMKSLPCTDGYLATDVSMEFLRKLGPVTAVCCSACTLPFSRGSFECALAMAVLHHLNCTELLNSIREVHRVLKPGGTFLVLEDWCFARGITPFEEEARKLRFRNGTSENHLAEGTWLREFQSAGFSCRKRQWTCRPFHSSDERLLRWAEKDRRVRMLFLELERLP